MAESTVLELKQNEIGDRKQRNSNLELMRILLMLGMIAHHYVVNSGVEALYDLSSFSWDVWFLQIFGMFGKTGINCFTLLTGYFMVKSNITPEKVSEAVSGSQVLLYRMLSAVSGYRL